MYKHSQQGDYIHCRYLTTLTHAYRLHCVINDFKVGEVVKKNKKTILYLYIFLKCFITMINNADALLYKLTLQLD